MLGKSIGRYEQQKAFPKWSKDFPEVGNVHSQVLQNVAVRVDLAFRAFFRRVEEDETPGVGRLHPVRNAGFPRVKGDGYDSFCYPQSGFKVGESTISVSLFGKQEKIKAKLHRPLVGKVKTCCIHRVRNKWFVCFAVEQEDDFLPPSTEAVGLDAGLNSFLALSNGEFVDNPRFFRKDEKALAKAGRRQAKTKKRSQARRKANKVLSRLHERIRNRRHDFVHQTARCIVNGFGVIAVEKLNVKNMSRRPKAKADENNPGEFLPNGASSKAGLNKSIADASWSMFRTVLTHKAESAGREVSAVNPAYTSQDCHACGYRAKKKLSERWHFCPNCSASLDRDTNAAINILNLATNRSGITERQGVAPVEAPPFNL